MTLHVKSNAEKVNYLSDPGSLTVKQGNREKRTKTIFYMLFKAVFNFTSAMRLSRVDQNV